MQRNRLGSGVVPGSRWLLWSLALLLFAVLVTGLVFKYRNEYQLEIEDIQRDNSNLVRVLEESTLGTLRRIDQDARFVKAQYELHDGDVDIARMVREGMLDASRYNQIGVISASGMYVMSNLSGFARIYLGDRDHFRVHALQDCQCLMISRPVLGRVTGKWSLQMTRRLNHRDGTFAGVVVVSLDPRFFTALYQDMNIGEHGVIALLGDDGIVRARRSGGNVLAGQDVLASPLLQHVRSMDHGAFEDVSTIDHVARFYAFRRLQDYPMAVVVGVSRDEALAAFRQRGHGYLLFGAVFSLVLLAFCVLAHRALLRQAEFSAKLARSTRQAERARAQISEFIALVTRDMRDPLGRILHQTGWLRNSLDDASHREAVITADDNARHLLDMIDTIRDLGQIESGQLRLHPGPVDVRALLVEVLAMHEDAARDKGLSLSLTCMPDLPQVVMCDPLRLRQIVHHLLHNAVKFTDAGAVQLRAESADGFWVVRVKDTGPGLEAAVVQRLFDKLGRMQMLADDGERNAGLGLVLCRALSQCMGGDLMVESEAGKGSEFICRLPA